jgi:hypothetical protein
VTPPSAAPTRASGGPRSSADLSVVVPSVTAGPVLVEVIEALTHQRGARIEILLPERTGAATREQIAQRFPAVTIMPVDPGTPIPAMRRLAFSQASAAVIAVIEDHVLVPPDWAARLLGAVRESQGIVGGWIRNDATERLRDRAAYLCEYGHMLVPIPSGPAPWVTGNNVGYRRDVLESLWTVVEEDRWEDRLHAAAREKGIELQVRSDIVAGHKMQYRSAMEYAGQRFLYSRAFAAMRLRGAARAKRLAYGLGAFVLPPVLLLRIVKSGWAAAEQRADLMRSLPLLALFVSAWSLGEAAGALLGPGDALGRVR